MENLKIEPFDQTLIQEGGDLEVGLSTWCMEIPWTQGVGKRYEKSPYHHFLIRHSISLSASKLTPLTNYL
jgi:hypothetical protein